MEESILYLDPIGVEEECQRILAVFHQHASLGKAQYIIGAVIPNNQRVKRIVESLDGLNICEGVAPKKAKKEPKQKKRGDSSEQVVLAPQLRQQFAGDREEILAAFLADRDDPALKKKMILSWIPLVHLTIKNGVHTDLAKFQYDDYVSMGLLGLFEAIESYNPTKGATFRTYAIGRIRFAILNGTYEELGWHNAFARIEAISREEKKIKALEEREPLDEATCDRKTWLQERREEILKVIQVDSLERPILGVNNEAICVGTLVRDPLSVEEEYIFEHDYTLLARRVAGLFSQILTKREERIIRLRHGEGMTLAEVGREVGLGGERVRQIESEVLEKIRDVMESKKQQWLSYLS